MQEFVIITENDYHYKYGPEARGIRVDGEEYSMVPGDVLAPIHYPGRLLLRIRREGTVLDDKRRDSCDQLSSFHGGGGRDKNVDFAQIMGWRSFRSFQEATLPAATVILKRLMEHVRNGRATNSEIECSVLELLAMSFRSFLADGRPGRSRLGRTDMLRIREARDILLERMAEPPSLLELSRLIGLNDYKLKTGFKEIYGAAGGEPG